MFPVLPILLVAVVLAAGRGIGLASSDPIVTLLVALAPVAVILVAVFLFTFELQRRVRARRIDGRALVRSERLTAAAQWMLVIVHGVAVLGYGFLDLIHNTIGDLVIVDELIAMMPPLLGLAGIWAIRYPVERYLREHMMVRRLDEGRTCYPMPSRGHWVLNQMRMQIGMLFVPLIVIAMAHEVVERLIAPQVPATWPTWGIEVVHFGVGLTVFAFAPLLVRRVLVVTPLRSGEVHDDLDAICARHRVRVRDHLVWQTEGAMINAAVMGLIAPLRYVLLTDELLEVLPRQQVRAVMAHEIGHVRERHMPWLVIVLLGLTFGATLLVEPLRFALVSGGVIETERALAWLDLGSLIAIGIVIVIGFGWTSRRFERQADTFAVRHLSDEEPVDPDAPAPCAGPRIIRPDAVAAFTGALDQICVHNGVSPRRRNWRHGSIAWRTSYLKTLVGRTLGRYDVDRTVRLIKCAALAMVLIAPFALYEMNEWMVETLNAERATPAVPVLIVGPVEETP